MSRKMTQRQLARLPRLLWMYYSPAELADEIGLNVDTIYKSYIPAGCPHKRDEQDRIWIIGTQFRRWALDRFQRRSRPPMPDGFAYCLRCRKPTQMLDVRLNPQNVYTEMVIGRCAECGARTNRTRKRQ